MLEPPLGRPWLLYGILACSLALNLAMVIQRQAGDEPAPDAAALDGAVDATASAGTLEQPAGVAGAAAPASAVAAQPTAAPAPAVDTQGLGDWTVSDATVRSTLSGAFASVVESDADALSAVYSRLFVWDMNLRRDLRKGDRVEVAWRKIKGDEVDLLAARLHSSKLGRTIAAYRWQAPGDAFTSYWSEDGTEVPLRLQSPPLRDYEQITSLLKDRPNHKGMDFKAPIGTPVVSPFDGVVTRSNWNWKSNGNCLEIRYPDGAVAKFLHLSENRVEPGTTVKAGQVVGLVGNTGRSTAPHLHYQVEVRGKVVDPLEYHGTERRRVEGAGMVALQREIARQDALMSQVLAAR
jgi:murein DD-endopeptidase MepM/ murein hydrolase activator NlpD